MSEEPDPELVRLAHEADTAWQVMQRHEQIAREAADECARLSKVITQEQPLVVAFAEFQNLIGRAHTRRVSKQEILDEADRIIADAKREHRDIKRMIEVPTQQEATALLADWERRRQQAREGGSSQ